MKSTIIALSTLVFLSACGATTSPTQFYVLAPPEVFGKKAQSEASELSLGIGPIEMPRYLDRPQIVTKASRYKLNLAEFDQWAEPLKDNLSRVLVENISTILGTERVSKFPSRRPSTPDYQISINILSMDVSRSNSAHLNSIWSIYKPGLSTAVAVGKSNLEKKIETEGYEGVVEAMSINLMQLSIDISSRVKLLN